MLQLKIVLDEEKILKEDEYDLPRMWEIIDGAFLKDGLVKVGKGLYRDTGSEKDFAFFWRNIWMLAKCDWFMSNAKEFLWYNGRGRDCDENVAAEDILAYCRTHPRTTRSAENKEVL